MLLCLVFLFYSAPGHGQNAAPANADSVKRPLQVSFALGQTYCLYTRLASVIDFNIGFQVRGYCRFADRWRADIELTRIIGYSYESWESVRQNYYDVNLHYLFVRLNKNSLYYSITGSNAPVLRLRKKNQYHKPVFLYALAGFHTDEFNATYKGDPLLQSHQISQMYTNPGTRKHFLWYGANFGLGKEKTFKRFTLYSEFKIELNERFPDVTFSIGFKR